MFVNGKFFELIEGGRHNSEQDSGAHRPCFTTTTKFFSKKLFLICILFFGQRAILSRLCISNFRGFFRDFSVFRRSEHAWMTGILVTRVNSDESAQSARCARLPRHMLSHHVFIFVIEHQRAGLACESTIRAVQRSCFLHSRFDTDQRAVLSAQRSALNAQHR